MSQDWKHAHFVQSKCGVCEGGLSNWKLGLGSHTEVVQRLRAWRQYLDHHCMFSTCSAAHQNDTFHVTSSACNHKGRESLSISILYEAVEIAGASSPLYFSKQGSQSSRVSSFRKIVARLC